MYEWGGAVWLVDQEWFRLVFPYLLGGGNVRSVISVKASHKSFGTICALGHSLAISSAAVWLSQTSYGNANQSRAAQGVVVWPRSGNGKAPLVLHTVLAGPTRDTRKWFTPGRRLRTRRQMENQWNLLQGELSCRLSAASNPDTTEEEERENLEWGKNGWGKIPPAVFVLKEISLKKKKIFASRIQTLTWGTVPTPPPPSVRHPFCDLV